MDAARVAAEDEPVTVAAKAGIKLVVDECGRHGAVVHDARERHRSAHVIDKDGERAQQHEGSERGGPCQECQQCNAGDGEEAWNIDRSRTMAHNDANVAHFDDALCK